VTQAIDRQFLVPIPILYMGVIVTGLIVLLLFIVRQRAPLLLALAAMAVVASVPATISTQLVALISTERPR